MLIEYITLAVYFVILLGLGAVFSRFNKNLSDFARGGGRGTWWILGSSILMAGISAFTFTGNGSAAFEAGPTFLIIYAANALGYLFGWLFLARWYRQTRAYTFADVIRGRFGTPAEQFSAYKGILLGPLGAAVSLWALGVFVSSVFGFPIAPTVLIIGIVVVIYSVSGGSWAVMATDFVQGVIMMGITTTLAILALVKIGGLGEFFAWFSKPEVAESFKFVKDPGQFPGDRFTWKWIFVIFIMQLLWQVNLGSASRFLAAKDGREAARASLLAMVLMMAGTLIWFIPPMVARFLYADQVMAMDIKEPATAAYAVIAKDLLPNGLLGLMIAAMFSATMSSMDTGLTAQTSSFMRNIVPRLREAFGMQELSDRANLLCCRIVSSVLGAIIISLALILATVGEIPLFDSFLLVGSVIGLPMAIPLISGLFLRRLTPWAYFLIIGCALMPSIYSFISEGSGGEAWTIQDRTAWVLAFGAIGTMVAWLLRNTASEKFRKNEVEFFRKMTTPVDFEAETGDANDAEQALLLGKIVTGAGCLLLLFLFVPNPWNDRFIILGFAAFVIGVGGLLLWAAKKYRDKIAAGLLENSAAPAKNNSQGKSTGT